MRNNLGALYLEGGELDRAQAIYREIVEMHPENHIAWNNLGVIEMKRQNHSVALRLFERALVANPNHAAAYENRDGARDFVRAAESFLERHAAGPPAEADSALLLRYSHACFSTGDFACAERFHARWLDARERDQRMTGPVLKGL